jgi:hypothetical protein
MEMLVCSDSDEKIRVLISAISSDRLPWPHGLDLLPDTRDAFSIEADTDLLSRGRIHVSSIALRSTSLDGAAAAGETDTLRMGVAATITFKFETLGGVDLLRVMFGQGVNKQVEEVFGNFTGEMPVLIDTHLMGRAQFKVRLHP